MPLESATYIPDLVATNPVHGDGLNQADSHLRLLKSVLQAQFPNITDNAVTGTAADLNQVTGGHVSTAGSVLSSSSSAGVGYKTGAGGTVTQATSQTTAVTINTITGKITMFSQSMTGGATVLFNVNNSSVAATDIVAVSIAGGLTSTCIVCAIVVSAGLFQLAVTNVGSTFTQAPNINFAIIKGVTS